MILLSLTFLDNMDDTKKINNKKEKAQQKKEELRRIGGTIGHCTADTF